MGGEREKYREPGGFTRQLHCYAATPRYTTLHSTCEHCTGDLRMVIRSTSTMCKNDYSFC